MTTETIDNTPLGDRMKAYEFTFRPTMPRRAYTLMRLDGRAFHTYLKNAKKPFDDAFVKHMDHVAVALCQEIQGAQFAYTQSDEVSLLITDFQSLQTEPWFGGRVDKMTSISASLAAVVMDRWQKQVWRPQFDCRVWSMTDPVEVANYFVWRQRDAVRNSIQMLAQHYYKPRALEGKSTDELQDILFREQGVNWNDLDAGLKHGRIIYSPAALTNGGMPGWTVAPAPHFAAQPDNLLALAIPPLPSLRQWHAEEVNTTDT